MAVVKNMIVRVGADLSGLIGGFDKGGKAMGSFKKQASDALRSTTLSQANLTKAMAQGGRNTAIVSLADQIRELEAEQKALQAAGFGWGYEGFEGNEKLLRSLRSELKEYISSLASAEDATEDVTQKTGRLGSMAKSAGSWLKQAAARVLGIEKNSKTSSSGVEGLLRSIRRLGIVSLGLRLTRAVFGELGTIVRQYISENAALQAQVEALKSSFGQALAPAVNLVTNALAALMPYVVGVSNAIGSLITSLFGSGWTTVAADANAAAKAIGAAGSAQKDFNRTLQGFDEITKLDSKNSGGGGGSSSTTSSAGVEGKVPAWLTSLTDKVKEAISQDNWVGVGQAIADSLNNGIAALNMSDVGVGETIAGWINNGIDVAVGLVEDLNWGDLGNSIRTEIIGLLTNIDWKQVFSVLGSLGGTIFSAISLPTDIGKSVGNYFREYIAEAQETHDIGNDIGLGIILGICDAFANVGTWLKENVLDPLVAGFKRTFKIQSPAAHPDIRSVGENILLGVFEGIKTVASDPIGWLKENVFNPVSKALQDLFEGKTLAELVISVKNTSSKWWSDVKSWWNGKVGSVKEFTTSVKNEASTWWSNVKSWWSNKVGQVAEFSASVKNDSTTWWSDVKSWWSDQVGSVKEFTTSVKDDAASWWLNTKTWWADKVGSVDSFATSVRNEASTWWSNVKTWWREKIGTLSVGMVVKNEASTWWSNVKTWWGNTVGNLTTKLNIKVPTVSIEWSKVTVFGKTFNYPSGFDIKWNAMGAILNGAQLFGRAGNTWLGGGEAGREAVLPLDRNTWWMDKIADRVALRVNTVQNDNQTITINLILDGKIITSTVVRNINAQARSTGHNPLAAWM